MMLAKKTLLLLASITALGALGAGIARYAPPQDQSAHIASPDPAKYLSKGMLWNAENPEQAVATANVSVPPSSAAPDKTADVPKSALPPAVPDTKNPAMILATICTGSDAGHFNCYANHYIKLVREKGISAAMADLRARYSKDGFVISQCHPLTHTIGQTASEKFSNPGDAFDKGDSFCWSGYYHGVMEGVVGRIGEENLAATMDDICTNIKGKSSYSFDYYNCVHGLGHGVMELMHDELFDSLGFCDKLTGSWEQFSCASGAYMENVIVEQKGLTTKYLKPEDPLYPCTASPEKYKTTCYLMQSSYILKVTGGDFAKTFFWCEQAEAAYQNTCYESIGRDASGRSVSDVETTNKTCLLGKPGDQQMHCVVGAVKDFISYFHSDAQAKQLCESFTDEKLQATCARTATDYYAIF